MKPIVRIKQINGKEYWYEDTPYYDPEKKQIRQKSRYLGKNINGSPVKVRSEPVPGIASVPKAAYTHGNLLPLHQIVQELRMDEYLGDLATEEEKETILALAIHRILRPSAMHLVAAWYEENSLSLDHPDLPLSSQQISDLLSTLGESGVPEEFMHRLMRDLGTDSTLIYDITSLSSSSQLLPLLEYGYNRDGLDLPQVNFSLILDTERSIPVLYDLYPGSIVDVVTLKNTIARIQALGATQYTLVLDRGFYSQGNLEELLEEDLSFVIPASLASKPVKELLTDAQRDLESVQYLRMYQKEPIFVKPVVLRLREREIRGFCYYDLRREQNERNLFYLRLHDLKQKLESLRIPRWRRAEEVFREWAGGMANYFSWRQQEDRFVVEYRQNAIAQRVNRMGKQIILSHGPLDWEECLTVYRERDGVEKAFRTLKNDLQVLPLQVRKESTLKGFLFVTFLSLILRMRLLKRMQETGLLEEYTLEGMLLELAKIKKVRLANGEILTTEVSKKQRGILEVLGLCA
ncbi:MAG: IS1634 family transposase [Methanomicrobiales archaeon]|nr:IS1634 family transposase [Methanomicrobiales archaeon]MDI6876202.1 IS1634 family transposase [Methanomicrobiales archaeon]